MGPVETELYYSKYLIHISICEQRHSRDFRKEASSKKALQSYVFKFCNQRIKE